jgi:hypothetical protein
MSKKDYELESQEFLKHRPGSYVRAYAEDHGCGSCDAFVAGFVLHDGAETAELYVDDMEDGGERTIEMLNQISDKVEELIEAIKAWRNREK